jgi:hypothetical protein
VDETNINGPEFSNTIEVDFLGPGYVSTFDRDFSLESGGQAVDAGNQNQITADDLDTEGIRLTNSPPDIGCYEFEN